MELKYSKRLTSKSKVNVLGNLPRCFYFIDSAARRKRCCEPTPGPEPSEMLFLRVSQTLKDNPRCSISIIQMQNSIKVTSLAHIFMSLSPPCPFPMSFSYRYPSSCRSCAVRADSSVQCLLVLGCSL